MAFDAYLKLDGLDGESTDAGHEKWIELVSYEVGADNASSVGSKSGGAGAGKASFKKLVIEKQSDKTSPEMFLKCCLGLHVKEATLDICKSGTDPKEAYLTFKFEKLFVNSIVDKGDDGSRSADSDQDDYQIERVEFSFGKLTWTYKEQDDQGSMGGAIEKHYDVTTNKGG